MCFTHTPVDLVKVTKCKGAYRQKIPQLGYYIKGTLYIYIYVYSINTPTSRCAGYIRLTFVLAIPLC
jgi:hypothetical protein